MTVRAADGLAAVAISGTEQRVTVKIESVTRKHGSETSARRSIAAQRWLIAAQRGRSPTFSAFAPVVAASQTPARLPLSGACSLRGYASKRWLVPLDRSSGVDSSVRPSLPWGFGNAFEEASAMLSQMMRALEEPLLSPRRGNWPWPQPTTAPSVASLLALAAAGDEPEVRLTRDSFRVTVDVHPFEPGEVHVKVCDGVLVIAARHGPRADRHGSTVSRELLREFAIPDEVDQQTLACRLSPRDGSLCVEAKLKPQRRHGGAEEDERVLEIKTDPELPESKGAGSSIGEKPIAAGSGAGGKKPIAAGSSGGGSTAA